MKIYLADIKRMRLFYVTRSFLFVLALFISCTGTYAGNSGKGMAGKSNQPDQHVFGFYYNWYGNTKTDGKEIHWAHDVIRQKHDQGPAEHIPGVNNISSNFYPELRNYSSNDPVVIARHMRMMAQARIGVVVVTWWGNSYQGTSTLPVLMDEAQRQGLKVCFHLEPYGGRSARSVRENIKNMLAQFGQHPALYRMNGKPCFFIYDSYLISAAEWAELLQPDGNMTIRGTELDAVVIGLWVKKGEEDYFIESGMDGYYTYFAATGFTYGSTSSNWTYLQQWANDHRKIFIPCVGPGYIDTRVRPWNAQTTRDREDGKYYDRMFDAALRCKAVYVGITSFNEWHEGTQIEPAVPFKCPEFKYLDYRPMSPDYYLKRTAYWVEELEKLSSLDTTRTKNN